MLGYVDPLQNQRAIVTIDSVSPNLGPGNMVVIRHPDGRTAAFDRWQSSYRTVSCGDTSLSVAAEERRSCDKSGDKSGIPQRSVYRMIYSFQQPHVATTAGS